MRIKVARSGGQATTAYVPAPPPLKRRWPHRQKRRQQRAAASSEAAPAEDPATHPGALNPHGRHGLLSPEPGAAAFIKVGDTVSEGQTLLIVEAMKTMNPITAPRRENYPDNRAE